jgi:hypothetical protein
VIAAVAIYCASLLATLLGIWFVHGEEGWLYSLVPMILVASSWLVLPAIVASLRPG